jgi:hypothetical protein
VVEPVIERRRIVLNLPQSRDYWQDVEILQRLDSLFGDHEGSDRVEFELDVDGERVRIVNHKHLVDWTELLAQEVEQSIGPQRIRVIEPQAVA